MTFREWVDDTRERVSRDGANGARRSVYELGLGALRRLDRTVPFGTPIWDREWDVLLVLDACRADLMAEVADEYAFVDDGHVTSIAGGSRSWMLRNFDPEYRAEMSRTAYVTGNPFSDEVLADHDFATMLEVWRHAWDDDLNTIPARAMTDVAIDQWRTGDADKMIVHYMQPHHPFVPDPMDSGMNRANPSKPDYPIWQQVRDGVVELDAVWEAYRENLRYVLDDVAVLLDSIDAESVAISADHGNAIGEYGLYGHGDFPIPPIRRVPWSVTRATDTESYEPELSVSAVHGSQRRDVGDGEVAEKLRDLGYL
jgi:hypothetical protein